MNRARIVGWGLYAPENVVKNEEFNKRYGKDVDTFLRRERNIYQRHFMREDQTTSDLVVEAAKAALSKAQLTAQDLDMIIVATDTPDYLSPATSAVVQHKLQATRAGTFDVNSACAGFVTALDVGAKYIMCDDRIQNVLVVGAYGMSKYLDWDDFKIATLFADGAGAVILQKGDSEATDGVLNTQFYTDGQFYDYMGIYGGGTAEPISDKVIANKRHLLQFVKKIPLETNPTHWPRLVNILLDRCNKTKADVKKYFFTQINIKSIQETMDILGEPQEKAHKVMDRFGYTGSAAIPMAIADAANQHLLKKGDLIMLVSSGGGVSMAATALEWSLDT